MSKFIHIKSAKFPILPGEQDEIVNDGMYGKALAEYLQTKLKMRGYQSPFCCCEDWGWWVDLRGFSIPFGVCIYSGTRHDDGVSEYACTDGARAKRQWSWKRFRFVDTQPMAEQLQQDLLTIFQADRNIVIIGTSDNYPF